jgi:hypothetical protein
LFDFLELIQQILALDFDLIDSIRELRPLRRGNPELLFTLPPLFFEIFHECPEAFVFLDQRFHVLMGVVANLENVVFVSSFVVFHRESRIS